MNDPKKIPCYECEHRDVTCHGSCERYKAWRAELDAESEKERETRRSDREFTERRRVEIYKGLKRGYDVRVKSR